MSDPEELKAENERLKADNLRLTEQWQERMDVAEQNERLKTMLHEMGADWVPMEVRTLEKEIAGLQSANADLEAERDRLMECTWCDFRYRYGRTACEVEAHEVTCSHSPLREIIVERDRLQAERDELRTKLGRRVELHDKDGYALMKLQAELMEHKTVIGELKTAWQKAESEAAAMREALLVAMDWIPEPDHHETDCPGDCEGHASKWMMKRALSTSAGRELQERVGRLEKALEFYADPGTYHGVSFFYDPPCGGFQVDFGSHDDPAYGDDLKPGARARAALAGEGR
jgi:DNA repair exonuclease SbcCD ATPase subunit